jgi:hypothetical protein
VTYGGRRHRKVDANCQEIVSHLRMMGLKVCIWNDEADLLVQYPGGWQTAICEVRPEGEPKTARQGRQEAFQNDFRVVWLQTIEDCEALRRMLLRAAGRAY